MSTRFGKYELLERIAVGGMAEIYLAIEAIEATDASTRRFVIIKRVRSDFHGDPDYKSFFVTEGRVALKCAHPNLPQTFETGDVDGVKYLAMEFIRGHTLLDLLRAAHQQNKRLSVASVVRIGIEVAAALEYLHDLQDVDGNPLDVVHRDVTPQNVMITASGSVKLIDFGVVRSAIQAHQTEAGVVKGKFAYIAPEQLRGGRRPDRRADLFSLGIVLHESLTGHSLFRGKSNEETMHRLQNAPIPDLTKRRNDVPQQLATLIEKALERSPKRRFQNATEMLCALEQAAEQCAIPYSMTRLRDEALALCGEPKAPLAPSPLPPISIARDPALAYFLEKSRVAPGEAVRVNEDS